MSSVDGPIVHRSLVHRWCVETATVGNGAPFSSLKKGAWLPCHSQRAYSGNALHASDIIHPLLLYHQHFRPRSELFPTVAGSTPQRWMSKHLASHPVLDRLLMTSPSILLGLITCLFLTSQMRVAIFHVLIKHVLYLHPETPLPLCIAVYWNMVSVPVWWLPGVVHPSYGPWTFFSIPVGLISTISPWHSCYYYICLITCGKSVFSSLRLYLSYWLFNRQTLTSPGVQCCPSAIVGCSALPSWM